MVTLSLITRTVGATHSNKSMQTSNNCTTYALEPPPRGTSRRRRRRLAHCNSPPRPQRARSREGTARRAQTALHSTPPQRRSRSRVPATHYAAGGPSPSASRRANAQASPRRRRLDAGRLSHHKGMIRVSIGSETPATAQQQPVFRGRVRDDGQEQEGKCETTDVSRGAGDQARA